MLLKVRLLLFALLLGACSQREVQLPEVKQVVEEKVEDYSEIFIFFDENTEQAELNKNSLITSTNWIFHIDKRNSLNQVGRYIEQMQIKKKNPMSPHSNPHSQNYFSVTQLQEAQKKLGFVNFTSTEFKFYDFSVLDANPSEVLSTILVEKDGVYYKGEHQNLSYFYHFAPKEKVLWIFDGGMSFNDFMRIYSLLQTNGTDISVVYYKE